MNPIRPRSTPLRVMGILNVTPDSFWANSRFETLERAVSAGRQMFDDGAWAVDVSGESTRPGAVPVSVAEELDRVVPVVAEPVRFGVVAVDTRHAEVAEAASAWGMSACTRTPCRWSPASTHATTTSAPISAASRDMPGPFPVLLGVSRKSFLQALTGREVDDRLAGSLAVIAPAWSAEVDIIRVHDVPETVDTIAMLNAVWG
ncbi:dihydropteroate synthase [Mycolicibacterium smegmatis]|jgi:dihydropteroate synthase|uniref:Dihydropteroate synthase n=1 Tax=Mycolicibacterium smegmatis (strain MKD8) TaxID=1214915 RepID=A0A2U9PUY8_MYCSE|nr:dihydropteroate synthase [Mycolicibacterium smegmatis]AWT55557.1 dihydropteroate synthase [Mycolicibacterium smegmatis MKD8]